MSGSDNTSGGGTGGGDRFPCLNIRTSIQVSGPIPAVVAQLKIGDVLNVVLVTSGGASLTQVFQGPDLVGGITGPLAAQLRKCIPEGHAYVATVEYLNGGQVRVLVEHA